jgi:hypothetical protein
MHTQNPNVSNRQIGFTLPLSFRFGVANLDICPNVVEALDKPAGLVSPSLRATRIHTITSSTGGCSHDFGSSRAYISTAT